MRKTFVIQVEYPDNDVIPSEEIVEVTKESFEYILSRYFGANIVDGDYDRIKVKEVTDFIALAKRMRDTQQGIEMMERFAYKWTVYDHLKYDDLLQDKAKLESEVDEYLKKMEI
jgi:hypothetical protein